MFFCQFVKKGSEGAFLEYQAYKSILTCFSRCIFPRMVEKDPKDSRRANLVLVLPAFGK